MKKLLFLLMTLIASVCSGNAQSTQVATLSHDGSIKSYASVNALRDAYNDAVDGDVITLSSGTFAAVNFEKRITVRGSGMGVKVNDSDPYIEPTLLTGDFSIKAGADADNNFKLEGILSENTVTLEDVIKANFSKCRFKKIKYYTDRGGFENVTFINCVIFGEASMPYNASMNFFGCYLKNISFYSSGSNHILTNCILETDDYFNDDACMVKNSIYIAPSNNGTNRGTAFNCIWTGGTHTVSDPFNNTLESHNNTNIPEGTEIFKEGTFYQLTDDAKKYLGDDGTEVGIYGGSLAFDPTPTNPQIIKFNVAPKTTADGKLSIDIEVNTK